MTVKQESERPPAINANTKEATQIGHLDTLQVCNSPKYAGCIGLYIKNPSDSHRCFKGGDTFLKQVYCILNPIILA